MRCDCLGVSPFWWRIFASGSIFQYTCRQHIPIYPLAAYSNMLAKRDCSDFCNIGKNFSIKGKDSRGYWRFSLQFQEQRKTPVGGIPDISCDCILLWKTSAHRTSSWKTDFQSGSAGSVQGIHSRSIMNKLDLAATGLPDSMVLDESFDNRAVAEPINKVSALQWPEWFMAADCVWWNVADQQDLTGKCEERQSFSWNWIIEEFMG